MPFQSKKAVAESLQKSAEVASRAARSDNQIPHGESLIVEQPTRATSNSGFKLGPTKVVTNRTQIRDEIVTSEDKYVRELRTLVTVFLRPLEDWVSEGMGGLSIAADGVSEVFSNVEQILTFNSHLLRNLKEEYDKRKLIGGTFKQAENLLETYSTYVQNYPNAMKTLEACETYPEFKVFIRACELQEACHGLDLRSYLIQPVQRVPRYRLLLTELIKHVSYAASQLNKNARDRERFLRVLELQDEFRETFATPSRYVVKEGELLKVCNGGPRRYKFVLFNDMLMYGTVTLRAKILLDNVRKYKQHQQIPLQECLILEYNNSVAFLITRPGRKSFVAMASSAEEKQAWLDAFSECFHGIRDLAQTAASSDVSALNSPWKAADLGLLHAQPLADDEGCSDNPPFDGLCILGGGLPDQEILRGKSPDRITQVVHDSFLIPISPAKARPSSAEGATPRGAEEGQTEGVRLARSLTGPSPVLVAAAALGMSTQKLAERDPERDRASWSATTETAAIKSSDFGVGVLTSGSLIGGDDRATRARQRVSRVQVWVPVDGRTELHEVSLRGLPAESDFGVFRVKREERLTLDIESPDKVDRHQQAQPSPRGRLYRRKLSAPVPFGSFRASRRRRDSVDDIRGTDMSNSSRSGKRSPLSPHATGLPGLGAVSVQQRAAGTAGSTGEAASVDGISDGETDSGDNDYGEGSTVVPEGNHRKNRQVRGSSERASWSVIEERGGVRKMLSLFESHHVPDDHEALSSKTQEPVEPQETTAHQPRRGHDETGTLAIAEREDATTHGRPPLYLRRSSITPGQSDTEVSVVSHPNSGRFVAGTFVEHSPSIFRAESGDEAAQLESGIKRLGSNKTKSSGNRTVDVVAVMCVVGDRNNILDEEALALRLDADDEEAVANVGGNSKAARLWRSVSPSRRSSNGGRGDAVTSDFFNNIQNKLSRSMSSGGVISCDRTLPAGDTSAPAAAGVGDMASAADEGGGDSAFSRHSLGPSVPGAQAKRRSNTPLVDRPHIGLESSFPLKGSSRYAFDATNTREATTPRGLSRVGNAEEISPPSMSSSDDDTVLVEVTRRKEKIRPMPCDDVEAPGRKDDSGVK